MFPIRPCTVFPASCALLSLLFCVGVLVVAGPAPVEAQINTGTVPANAKKASYGNRWECNPGFRQNAGACLAVAIPANAYSTNKTYGKGWQCKYGYVEATRETCTQLVIPVNAYLSTSGTAWHCERGYRREREACLKIEVPPNGFLSERAYGSGWECDRGYREGLNGCEAVKVPANGYLAVGNGGSGLGWNCERGYSQTAGACTAIVIPANGYFYDQTYGPGWKCERGFKAGNGQCAAVVLPADAHLDHSGNDWECDPPYQRRNEACSLTN